MLIWIKYLDRVIRGEATHPSALREGNIHQPVGGLTLIGAILGAIYGLCMSCYAVFQKGNAPLLQMVSTTLKVPALFLLTLAVTFPSLYVFNALVGSRLSMLSVLRLLTISLSVMLAVLASLGPIFAFFAASTTSYPFMLLLNVVIFAISGILGLRYLLITLMRLTSVQTEPIPFSSSTGILSIPPLPDGMEPILSNNGESHLPNSSFSSYAPQTPPIGALDPAPTRKSTQNVRIVFAIWMVVFALVGSQMAWVLRPFLGHPHAAFSWLRGREASFFEAIFHAIRALFS